MATVLLLMLLSNSHARARGGTKRAGAGTARAGGAARDQRGARRRGGGDKPRPMNWEERKNRITHKAAWPKILFVLVFVDLVVVEATVIQNRWQLKQK